MAAGVSRPLPRPRAAAAVQSVPLASEPAPSATAPPTPTSAPISTSTATAGVTLQVASFAARANAERALAMLQGAGIGHARLVDAIAAGQSVWRLRVGPVDPDSATELDARVRGLGFGPPDIVRD